MIPFLPDTYDRKLLYRYISRNNCKKKRDAGPSVELITFTEPSSIISEAYRSMRTSIMLANAAVPPKTILITSAEPGEGKTATAINAAISLSQLGSRVVLLDCDLRRPKCHKYLKLRNTSGLSDVLSGRIEIPLVIKATQIPNLHTVTAGRFPPNPAELLASPRMKQVLALLGESFDFVIIDSPPLTLVTDAVILSPIVDGVILVVKAGKTSKKITLEAKRRLLSVNTNILGVLVNHVDLRDLDYQYYERYYRSYGQGESQENGENLNDLPG